MSHWVAGQGVSTYYLLHTLPMSLRPAHGSLDHFSSSQMTTFRRQGWRSRAQVCVQVKYLCKQQPTHTKWILLCNETGRANEGGELAASYRWTGRVWEITGWSSGLQKKLLIILGESREYTSRLIKKSQKTSSTCNWLVFGNIRILTDNAQNPPETLGRIQPLLAHEPVEFGT